MKKRALLLIAILVISAGTQLFAETTESKFYSVYAPASRVFLHRLGYIVEYFTPQGEIKVAYFPMEWCTGIDSKVEIVYGEGDAYPYLSIFYEGPVIDHLRVYVYGDENHSSWGVLNYPENYDDKFGGSFADLKL